MFVITSAHRQAGTTGQENLACETFTTIIMFRGKGLFFLQWMQLRTEDR
jgi:hypothetical protein